ncbi:MAG TPA: hypothetical protein VEU76_00650 [Candidatus Udaeobacter sp.]|nr:hypothetical protein [Candidatus Udaeobacter sp.]
MSPRWPAAILLLVAPCGSAGSAGTAVHPSSSPASTTVSTPLASPLSSPACTVVTETTSPQSPVLAGTSVTATADSPCPMVDYRFQLVDLSTGVGLVMQDWGGSDSWTWATTQVGRYAIEADVRADGKTGLNPDASARVEVDVVRALPSGPGPGKCTAVTVQALPSSPVAAGTIVTATAQASGCQGADYRFQLVDLSTGVGLVMQDWTTSNSWTWDTTNAQAGRYAVRADARGASVAGRDPDATAQVEVDVVHGVGGAHCTSVSLTTSTTLPVPAGTRVTATAQASGCQGADYRFQLVDLVNGVGLVMQDWSTSNTWTWDTTGTQAGHYAVRVDVRGSGVASQTPDATTQVEVDVA